MEQNGGIYALTVIFYVGIIHEIQAHAPLQFYQDFMTFSPSDSPVFVSTHNFDDTLSYISEEIATHYIKYTTGKEDRQVAKQMYKLFAIGELKMLMFLDGGHQKLLDLLIHEQKLLNKDVTVLLPENDVVPEMHSALRLDTKLYLFAAIGNTTYIREIYNVNGKSVMNVIGTWNEDGGLLISTPNMWDRRNNLTGMEIIATTTNWYPFHMLAHNKSDTFVVGGSGFFIELLKILAQKLKFTAKVIPPVDGRWGFAVNGIWNGMVGMLVRKEADVIVAGLTKTKERETVLKFSKTILVDEFTLLTSKTKSTKPEPYFLIYIDIFPMNVWLVCGTMVIIIAFGFTIINMLGTYPLHDTEDSEEFNMLNGIGLTLSLFRLIYYEVNIKGTSSKIFFLISAVSTYLIIIHYTAYLTALTTSSIKEGPIRSFEDVIKGGYKVVVFNNSFSHRILKSSIPGTPMHHMYYNIMEKEPTSFLTTEKEEDRKKEELKAVNEKKTLVFGRSLGAISAGKMESLKIQG